MIDKEDSAWGFSGDASSNTKRGLLFGFIAIMFSGVGMAAWIFAKWYAAAEAVTFKYPGQALLTGCCVLAFRYAPSLCHASFPNRPSGLVFKFSRSHEDDGWGF